MARGNQGFLYVQGHNRIGYATHARTLWRLAADPSDFDLLSVPCYMYVSIQISPFFVAISLRLFNQRP